jgi:predicted transcriptional regulator of viral defense system
MDKDIISSRFGYQMEMLGQSTGRLDAARGSVRLDPRKPAQGTFNIRWRVYIKTFPTRIFSPKELPECSPAPKFNA